MKLIWKANLVVIGILAALSHKFYQTYLSSTSLPTLDFNEYWGYGNKTIYQEDTVVKSFKINFEIKILKDLKEQLKRELHFIPASEGVFFQHGFDGQTLNNFTTYWRDNYLSRSKEREDYFNKYKHFQTQINGLNIHFIHEKTKNVHKKTIYPILMLHGWPGSIREFYDVIPLLTNEKPESNYGFDVVCPSLPGFGWSEATSKLGLNPAQIAILMRNLMLRLGYQHFFVQGGDWGSVIASEIATIFPDNVIGYHSNLCTLSTIKSNFKLMIGQTFPSYFIREDYRDFYPSLIEKFMRILEESGYFHLQATKPNTIGTVLSHNPFGLAAYILEKFSIATDPSFKQLPDGGLTKYFTMDSLIDNLMIYYMTNSITSSVRIYKEAISSTYRSLQMGRVETNVIYGCASFQYDIDHTFDWQLRDKYPNLIHHTYHRNIGHFAALQAPEIFYKDLINFINKTLKIYQYSG